MSVSLIGELIAARSVPREALPALKRCLAGKGPEDYVVQNTRGGQVDRQPYNAALKRAQVAAGFITESGRMVHPHAMRSTYATHSLAASGDTAAVQANLGHTTPTMTLSYANPLAGRVAKVADALDAFVAAERAAEEEARKREERERKAAERAAKKAPAKPVRATKKATAKSRAR